MDVVRGLEFDAESPVGFGHGLTTKRGKIRVLQLHQAALSLNI